jgi:hypothetical protein
VTAATVKLTLSAPSGPAVFCRIEDESGEGYQTHLSTIPFDDPSNWYEQFLEVWRDDDRFMALSEPESRAFGERLYAAIFQGDIEDALQLARKADVCRLALYLEDSRLFEAPFELLHDGKSFLKNDGVRILRVLGSPRRQQAGFRPLKRMVVLLAEPTDEQAWGRAAHKEKLLKILRGLHGDEGRRVEITEVNPPTFTRFDQLLREHAANRKPFDAAYIVAHGVAEKDEEPKLILETNACTGQAIPADALAGLFRRHSGCFVLLNACQSSLTTYENPYSGIAQRLIADGQAGAIVAGQRSVPVDDALTVAETFFQDIMSGDLAEEAADHARAMLIEPHRSAVFTIYTQLKGPEIERAARIANLLNVDDEHKTLEVILPQFRMGYLKPKYLELKAEGKLATSKGVYQYPGDTIAVLDHDAAWSVVELFQQSFGALEEPGSVRFCDADSLGEDATTSHYLLIGSRSQDALPKILKNYSKDFDFSFSDPDGFWTLTDKRTNQVYKLEAPHQAKEPFKSDYLLIEKINSGDKTFFLLAGFTDQGTREAARHFVANWSDLQTRYGGSPFQRLLRWDPQLKGLGIEAISREVEPHP